MIVKKMVQGRPALVAYFRDNFVPVSATEATSAEIVFLDDKQPSSMIANVSRAEAALAPFASKLGPIDKR